MALAIYDGLRLAAHRFNPLWLSKTVLDGTLNQYRLLWRAILGFLTLYALTVWWAYLAMSERHDPADVLWWGKLLAVSVYGCSLLSWLREARGMIRQYRNRSVATGLIAPPRSNPQLTQTVTTSSPAPLIQQNRRQ